MPIDFGSSGTTSNRPSPSAGLFRYNNETGKVEISTGSSWKSILGGRDGLTSSTAAVTVQELYDAVKILMAFIGLILALHRYSYLLR